VTEHRAINQPETGIDIPFERIHPGTLVNMVTEFVTREWSDLGDSGYSLDVKVAQVLQQLTDNKAKVVYDPTSETWNIVVR
jgi:uncharacterized protein YheU (UPF0270 family)